MRRGGKEDGSDRVAERESKKSGGERGQKLGVGKNEILGHGGNERGEEKKL